MRRLRVLWLALGLVAVVVVYVGVTFVQVLSANGTDEPAPSDAIVVLGAAQYNGVPSPVFARRLDRAQELWTEGVAPLVVTTGSKQEGDVYTEGFAGYDYLRRAGLPESALVVVTDGASTWEQLSATARVLRERGLQSVVLVSDPYHVFRAAQMAKEVGLSPSSASTDGSSSLVQLVRETAAVSVGRVIGYRRVDNWLSGVG